MFCSDPRLTYLNELGYNVVKLPRTGIEPLDVFGKKEGPFQRLGRMPQIWVSSIPEPTFSDNVAGNLKGSKTAQIKVDIGLEILGNILNALAGQNIAAKAAYADATEVQFEFGDVQLVGVDPFIVGNYLESGQLKTSPFVREFVLDPRAKSYIVTEVLKADTITVMATENGTRSVSVSTPVLQGIAGGNLSIDLTNASSGVVTYKGPKKLTFGFKVFQTQFSNDKWAVQGTDAGKTKALSINKGGSRPLLLETSRLMDFEISETANGAILAG
jgi:hypothetical protein